MPEDSRIEAMRLIVEEIRNCRKCGLWKGRRNTVPGEGSLSPLAVFIGEAPGYWEDVKGRPFVGAAGRLLEETLLGVGLSREDVYITNILKCRPPGNRDPRPEEVKACTPFLDRQLELMRPEVIVTLGRHSAMYMLSKAGYMVSGITAVRGKIYRARFWGTEVHILPTFHPAAALYNVRLKEYLERDFRLLREELERLGLI
ncbi:MAG: DNA polymerase [Candidatus Bathyarchaeota archaeon B26-2]|nr:MAG: DNA polymerase [Candidatus Bathyarchaeota archaeon B26-2]